MSGYTKLFGSIIHSTVWQAPAPTRLVWITMLALADRDGIIEASVPGLAKAAAVGLEDCQEALRAFQAPDPFSRTPDNEGRRIEVVDGGWRLLNHSKYRERKSRDDMREKTAERVKRFRDKKKAEAEIAAAPSTSDNAAVTHVTPSNPIAAPDPAPTPGSGSLSPSFLSPASQRSVPDPDAREPDAPGSIVLPPGDITGHLLAMLFGRVRAEKCKGALPWQVPTNSPLKSEAIVTAANQDPSVREDIVPSMQRFYESANRNAFASASKAIKEPTFGFACWVSQFTSLREEIRNRSPATSTGPPRGDIRTGHVRAEVKPRPTGDIPL